MLAGREHKGKYIGTDKYNEVSEMTQSHIHYHSKVWG